MVRKLIDYLPPIMQEYVEIQQIMQTEQTAVSSLWDASDDALNDQFLQDATDNGVSRWEKLLGILPKNTDTLDERKFRILTKMNEQLPCTESVLKNQLSMLCGVDGYAYAPTYNDYKLSIKLALENKNNYQSVCEYLKNVIPANIDYIVSLMYNTHEILSKLTYAQMAEYTHKQLREDVLAGE